MENCIVKNLIASVPGDLPVLGKIVIRCTSTGTIAISTRVTVAQDIQFIGPTGSVIKTVTVNPGSNVNVSQDASSYDYIDVVFRDKYAVERISCLRTSPASADALYELISGDINYMQNIDVVGGLAEMFPDNEIVLPALTVLAFNNPSISGSVQGIQNIVRFSDCLNMTTLSCVSTAGSVLFSGDIKKFFEDMCKNGRTSGTLQMTINKTSSFMWGQTPIITNSFTISITFSGTGCALTKTAGTFLFDSISYNKTTGVWS